MTEPTSPTPPDDVGGARPVAATSINEDTACARCGYNLRGLRADAKCPECGSPVIRSRHGNSLRFADIRWLRRLYRGMMLRLWVYAITVVVTGPDILSFVLRATIAQEVIDTCVNLAWLVAIWLITSPEPMVVTDQRHGGLRRVLRILALAQFVPSVVGFSASIRYRISASGMTVSAPATMLSFVALVATGIAYLAMMFGELVYLRGLARRIPDERMERRTTTVIHAWAWSYGILALAFLTFDLVFGTTASFDRVKESMWQVAVSCVVVLSTLAGGVCVVVAASLTIMLFVRYRNRFRACLREAQVLEARATAGSDRL